LYEASAIEDTVGLRVLSAGPLVRYDEDRRSANRAARTPEQEVLAVLRFAIRLVVNAIAIVVAAWLVPGIVVSGGPGTYLGVALIFGVVNATIGTVLKVLTCPLILLTLGLFTLVINGLMLQFSAWWAGIFGLGFSVSSFWAAFLGALVVSVVSATFSVLVGDAKVEAKTSGGSVPARRQT
jgi:putative membrane protein